MNQKYPKPPIVEAILQCRYAQPFTDGEVKRIPRLLESQYPKSKEEADYQLQFEFNPAIPSSTPPPPKMLDSGARLLSANDQRVVITRSSSIVFSYQAPYPGWDEFKVAAKQVFDTIREKLGYRKIAGLGLRYVNRLDIPAPKEADFLQATDYLLLGMTVPKTPVSMSVNGFQGTTEVALSHDGLIARLTAATLVGALINHVSLLCDIDIIASEVPSKADDMWALIDRMREDKNVIFEASITDNARRLFGWKGADSARLPS